MFTFRQVGLVARMYINQAYPTLLRGQVPAAKVDVVSDAVLEAVFPDGHRYVAHYFLSIILSYLMSHL